MLTIKRTGKFDQMLRDLLEQNPELTDLVKEKILLFCKKPTNTRLNNHQLKRRLEGKWAFSITANIRIVYEWQSKSVVRFLAIGSHTTVYKKP